MEVTITSSTVPSHTTNFTVPVNPNDVKANNYEDDRHQYLEKYVRYINREQECDKPADDFSIYECNECMFKCSQKFLIRQHMKAHSIKTHFQCKKCCYQCNELHALQTHLLIHKNVKPYKCDKCCYRSYKKLYLNVHMKSHTATSSFKCSSCEYTAIKRNILTRHFNQIHLNISDNK